ncbi:MAG: long-chain fatty acid--CoA ligase [Rhodospirillales bacterium]|nr:long-chain fatty acid--CoA ligase [Rhodospirillales bacterium]
MIDFAPLLAAYPVDQKILCGKDYQMTAQDIEQQMEMLDLSAIPPGSSVAVIGDFDPASIVALIQLFQKGCVVVPLTVHTRSQHDYFFNAAAVQYVVEKGIVKAQPDPPMQPPIMVELGQQGKAGLIMFSSGTSGRPKAILHDVEKIMARFKTAKKTLRTISFLMFDHWGGLNTFFYTLYAGGQIIVPDSLDPESVFRSVERYRAELLPTTPTFLRLACRTVDFESLDLSSLKLITYGTEVMDEITLSRVTALLPETDFRQTYGLSELGVFSVRSRARDSLFIQIGGDGVKTRILDNVLWISSPFQMIGYLNETSPFDSEGFYNTKDIVEVDGEWLRITGRDSEIVNIGGVKVSPIDVEEAVCGLKGVVEAQAFGRPNPVTGQHLELKVVLSPENAPAVSEIKKALRQILPEASQPSRIQAVEEIPRSHRFKRTGNGMPQ